MLITNRSVLAEADQINTQIETLRVEIVKLCGERESSLAMSRKHLRSAIKSAEQGLRMYSVEEFTRECGFGVDHFNDAKGHREDAAQADEEVHEAENKIRRLLGLRLRDYDTGEIVVTDNAEPQCRFCGVMIEVDGTVWVDAMQETTCPGNALGHLPKY